MQELLSTLLGGPHKGPKMAAAAPTTFERAKVVLDKAHEAMAEAVRQEGPWSLVKETPEEKVYSRSVPGRPTKMFYCVGSVRSAEFSPRVFVDRLLIGGEFRQDWNPDGSCDGVVVEEGVHPGDGRTYRIYTDGQRSAAGGLVSQRDFAECGARWFETDADGTERAWFVCADFDDPRFPAPAKGVVRGSVYASGYLAEKRPATDVTVIHYIVHINLGGWVPVSILHSALPAAMQGFYPAIRKHFQ